MHALTRALTAVLAVIVLAVPAAASARIDPPTGGASERTQDLRHLEAGGLTPKPAAPKGVDWSYDYESKAPQTAHFHAPAGVYWSYDYQAQTPAPRAHAAVPSGTSDDGIPWMTIGFIVAGTSLLISGAVFLSTRRRPPTAQPA
jgi:hypothetical protein